MTDKAGAKLPTEVSQKTFANWVNLTTKQVQNLRNEGLPSKARGARVVIPWPEGLHWYLKKKAGEGSPTAQAKAKTSVRMAEVELELKEIELAKELEQLVSLDFMTGQLSLTAERLRAKLLNMPGTFAPRLVGMRTIAEAQTAIETMVHEAMLALQETGEDPELDDDEDSTGGEAPVA